LAKTEPEGPKPEDVKKVKTKEEIAASLAAKFGKKKKAVKGNKGNAHKREYPTDKKKGGRKNKPGKDQTATKPDEAVEPKPDADQKPAEAVEPKPEPKIDENLTLTTEQQKIEPAELKPELTEEQKLQNEQTELYTKWNSILFTKEALSQIKSSIRGRFLGTGQTMAGNNFKKIFTLKNWQYSEEDPDANFEEFSEKIRGVILGILSKKEELTSPYLMQAEKVSERAQFILKLNTGFKMVEELKYEDTDQFDLSEPAIDDPSIDDLEPLEMTRSFSFTPGLNLKNHNSERKAGLEDWLKNYRKWKQSMTKQSYNVTSENCSSVVSVVSFLTHLEPINLKKLESALVRQAQRCCLRAIGLQFYDEFLAIAQNSWLKKYLVGVCASSFGYNIFERTEAANLELKSLILDLSTNILEKLMKMLIAEHKTARNFKVSEIAGELSKVKQTNNIDEVKDSLSTYFKTITSILGEVSGFLSNDYILRDEGWFDNNQELIQNFIYSSLELSLLCYAFRYLSPTYEQYKNLGKSTNKHVRLIINNLNCTRNAPGILAVLIKL
jgi:hypothetical protein